MSTDAVRRSTELSPFEQIRFARHVLQRESLALAELARCLDTRFCRAADLVYLCRGSIIVTGIGKAGLIGQKIVATLASTGTRSHWLHPAEAVHGDLGRVHPSDLVLILSQSGETEEVVRLLPSLADLQVPVVALTGSAESTLGRAAAVVLELGKLEEACSLGLAPSTSTTAMLAMGDALALVVSRMRNFTSEDFARFHPAGSLGRKLSRVEHLMRPLTQCRVASESKTIREVFVSLSMPGRRSGAIMLVNGDDKLSGIFTDSDLARLFEHRRDCELDGPIRDLMTRDPVVIPLGTLISEAVNLMARRKISELPVVDVNGKPVGLLDITDLVGVLPTDKANEETCNGWPRESAWPDPPPYRVVCKPNDDSQP